MVHNSARTLDSEHPIQRALLLVSYAALTATVSLRHEPWRDELEMWTMARDATVSDLFTIAPDMGTPLLWPLILMAFAKAGLPVAVLQILQYVLALSLATVVLFISPFRSWVSLLILGSYYFSFEYAVIARNYTLGIVLLFILLALDRKRDRYPYAYGILLLLLCQVSVHFWFISSVFAAVTFAESLRNRSSALAKSAFLGGLGSIMTLIQLWPTGSGQFAGLLVSKYQPENVVIALIGSIVPMVPLGLDALSVALATVTWISMCLSLLTRPRTLLLTLGSVGALAYIFAFKHLGGIWHFGLFFVILVSAMWLRELEPESPTSSVTGRLLASRGNRVFTICLTISLFISAAESSRIWFREFSEPHSMSRAMAHLLVEGDLVGFEISAHPAPVTAGILAYLPGKQFWYPAINNYGSYMRWDRAHAEGRFISVAEAIARVKKKFPSWDSTEHPVLFLTNEKIEEPEQYGFSLFLLTIDNPWRVIDEDFYLYVPSSFLR